MSIRVVGSFSPACNTPLTIHQATQQVVIKPEPTAALSPVLGSQDQLQGKSSAKPSANVSQAFVEEQCLSLTTFFVNGIRTHKAGAQESVNKLEQITGSPVKLIYNPTHGGLADGFEALQNLAGIETKISEQVREQIRPLIDEAQNVRLFAHSQGAAIVSDALREIEADYKAAKMPPAEIKRRMEKIEVIAFGGFATPKSFPKGVEVKLFNNEDDFIPQFADALHGVADSMRSPEADFNQRVGKLGKTIGSFVIINGAQAVGNAVGKFVDVARHNFYGKDLREGLADYVQSVGKAVESDHSMVVNDRYTSRNIRQGYIEDYKDRFA